MNAPISDDDPIHDLDAVRGAPAPSPIPPRAPSYAGASFALTVIGCMGLGYAAQMWMGIPYGALVGLGLGFAIALWDLKKSI